MTLYVCRGCNKVIEPIIESKTENGTQKIVYKCPKCGFEYTESKNHIHYGNDKL